MENRNEPKVEFNLEIEKLKVRNYLIGLTILFTTILVFLFLIGLSNLIPDLVANKKSTNISSLGDFGGYMNVVIAITSSITVGLVFYGVRMQSLEFQEMKYNLNNQEKINRAINLIDEYVSISNKIGDCEENDVIKKYGELFRFTKKINSLRTASLEDYINFEILGESLKKSNIIIHFERAIKIITKERDNLLHSNNRKKLEAKNKLGTNFDNLLTEFEEKFPYKSP